ncbi:heterocyst frequency control protein PatD [Chlorogloeopsis sp. ULAP01]|uniref:heterocyst frequency control protein PatD n=1 Tax=Chlorogloeopsis sp. ULAP01 TaxID=3056483 RepID=UPI0025AA8EDA|nr:heterocyst frequency control protein PatD [Chlorogloeopsis sp. ULAP01]MDM9381978.1 heterocyst frequency control protein PatD [Chlorogloeopsis sp. ULAP01]
MSFHQDKYQTFATLLEQFRSEVVTKQLDALGMQEHLICLKQFFQQQILPLTEEKSREQSYRTEMSKQLRLLEIDVMFYQGARQSATASERRKIISDRLTTLTDYCTAISQLQ